jgi:hypothetical protein
MVIVRYADTSKWNGKTSATALAVGNREHLPRPGDLPRTLPERTENFLNPLTIRERLSTEITTNGIFV